MLRYGVAKRHESVIVHLLAVCSGLSRKLLPSHCHGHSKVADLGSVIAIKQDIGQFQVAMNHITSMEVFHALNNIQGDGKIFVSAPAV